MPGFKLIISVKKAPCDRGEGQFVIFRLAYSLKGDTDSTLTHWGRVTHICVSNLTIIGSDNGLAPTRHQAIIWTSAGILLIGHLGRKINEILSNILTFSFTKIRFNVSSAEWQPFCLGLNVLIWKWIWMAPQLFRRQQDHVIIVTWVRYWVQAHFCQTQFSLIHGLRIRWKITLLSTILPTSFTEFCVTWLSLSLSCVTK